MTRDIFLGCKNGIRGVHENLVTFRDSKLPNFLITSKDAPPQKMQFLGAIKKVVSLNPCLKNAKWRKTSIESTVTSPKIGLNPGPLANFLACSKSPAREQGQMCTCGFTSQICIQVGKIFCVSKILHGYRKKQEDPKNIRLRVQIHFENTDLLLKSFRLHCYSLTLLSETLSVEFQLQTDCGVVGTMIQRMRGLLHPGKPWESPSL